MATSVPTSPGPLLQAPLAAEPDGLALGPALDGPSTRACYPLHAPRRLQHGAIVGDAGSGVSNLMTLVAVQARAAGPMVTAHINGHQELTNPALAQRSTVLIDGASDGDVAEIALEALERAVQARVRLMDSMEAGSYPAAGLPPLLVTIAEAPRVLAGNAGRWTQVADQAGTVGIGLLAAVPTLSPEAFGNSVRLRHLLTTNTIALRTSCRHTASLMAKTDVFASSGQGQCLATAPAGVGQLLVDGRTPVRFAPYWLATSDTEAIVERARRRWLVAYPDIELDAPTREAFTPDLARGAA